MGSVVKASGLVKAYGAARALDGLSLEVAEGEVHGFLGPNGAGKSTTLRVLLGMIRPDAGSVEVLGRRPFEEAVEIHKRLAYVPGDVSLWPNLSGGEVIDLLLKLRGPIDEAKRKTLIDRFQLDVKKACRTYSKGNRQKVALVAALASKVDLLLLDEPTSGLDPLMEAEFRACVAEEKRQGRSVLLSSHILSEVEALADRLSIVRAGKVVETGTLASMRHLTRTWITATLVGTVDSLEQLPGVHEVKRDGAQVKFAVDPEAMESVMRALGAAGVKSLNSAPPTLEDLFLRHYRSGAST